jgi:hypothetical protein
MGKGYDQVTDKPSQEDPDFPSITSDYDPWVIDKAGVLKQSTIDKGDEIIGRIYDAGLAEVVVLIINGVKSNPVIYATRFGRNLGLGKAGMASEGAQNGLVWLITPDRDLKVHISIGRGLPWFTSVDYDPIIKEGAECCNFGNYDDAVIYLLRETQNKLQELKPGYRE